LQTRDATCPAASRWAVRSHAFNAPSPANRSRKKLRDLLVKLGAMRNTTSTRRTVARSVLLACVSVLCGCDEVPRNVQSLLIPTLQRSEIVGLLAGFGTTFAAFPDLLA